MVEINEQISKRFCHAASVDEKVPRDSASTSYDIPFSISLKLRAL